MAQVLSDRHHYSPFICCLCSSLCSIENVVVTECSHPFCEGCLRDFVRSGEARSCPSCSANLEAHGGCSPSRKVKKQKEATILRGRHR